VVLFSLLALPLATTGCGGTINPAGDIRVLLGKGLQPTDVESAQCPASKFPDSSVHAQVAVHRPTGQVAAVVAAGSDPARGASYERDGFRCIVAREEGPTSLWATAWSGTYYAHSRARGSAQLAFSWGTADTY